MYKNWNLKDVFVDPTRCYGSWYNVKSTLKVKPNNRVVNKYQNGMPKMAKKAFNMGRFGTQYVAMVTELLSLKCGAHLIESYCKESNISDKNWLRYLFSSYWNKIWLSVWHHHLANLHILKTWMYLWDEKRYLKIVNSIFLLVQSTCLCFKMA